MDITQNFANFYNNLAIQNTADISSRYRRITRTLNKKYYGSESEDLHSLQVGSYGRGTAIGETSDLDMIYILPPEVFSRFNSYTYNGQSALLQEVKNEILKTYSQTVVGADGQVIVIKFADVKIEIVPAFENNDGSFKFPDSNDGGSWKTTNPRPEITAINDLNGKRGKNLKPLAKMVRAWKNANGASMSGLLIDTMVYNFFLDNNDFNQDSFSRYHFLVRDFFKFLSEQNKDQAYWYSPGSNQKVDRKGQFVAKAKKAYNLVLEAIQKNENETVWKIWKKVFGRNFPSSRSTTESASFSESSFPKTEEFIENQFPVDIRNDLQIDCEVSQDGFLKRSLRAFLASRIPLLQNRKLRFFISECDLKPPFQVKWKVRNVGYEAEKRNQIRGQILNDLGSKERIERTSFYGPHFVECYVIKDGICVARDMIDVPIDNH